MWCAGSLGVVIFFIWLPETVILYSCLQLRQSLFLPELIAARTQAGLTQGDVAARMGTTQSVVARIESGRGTPSMRTVQRFASAVGARAVVRMEPLTAA